MSNLIIQGRAPIPARNINNARAQAHFIAKKDKVSVRIECAEGNFETITVHPSGEEIEGD